MSRLAEQRLWDTMRKKCPKDFKLERIENVVGAGTPDVLVKIRAGAQGFGRYAQVELKAPKSPAKDSTRLLGKQGLHPSQIAWHAEVASMGIPSWILIRDSSGALYLVSGKHARTINDMSVDDLRIVSLADCWFNIFNVIRIRS